jgi:hypothetical protein
LILLMWAFIFHVILVDVDNSFTAWPQYPSPPSAATSSDEL